METIKTKEFRVFEGAPPSYPAIDQILYRFPVT